MSEWMLDRGPQAAFGEQSGSYMTATLSSADDKEKPLLEELGIDFHHICLKIEQCCNPFKPLSDVSIAQDSDLAGPLLIACAFGFCLLLTGKVHFGYIYGFGLVGCLSMYFLLVLMSVGDQCRTVGLQHTVSVLGYSLLPILCCAFVSFHFVPRLLAYTAATFFTWWAACCASKMFEVALDMKEQKWLIFYPLVLLYSIFTVISIF